MGNALAFFSALIATLWTWALIGLALLVGYHVSQERNLSQIPGFDWLPSFLRLPLQHQTDSSIVFTLAGVLSGFLLFFLIGYVWQALQDFVRLALVRGSVARAGRSGVWSRVAVDAAHLEGNPIAWHWFYYPLMSRLWREYAETLHRQTLSAPSGGSLSVQYRSTVAAETIFSTQALVDVPMRVEFFRHLPGIMTGAGIVSTFAGILLGLSEFNPSVEAQQITYQLKNLFSGITTAFIASFFAIFAAILVTIVEKFLLHWRYAQVAALQRYMDDLFRAGVEPEYLADLVHHGQEGFQQMQQALSRLTASLAVQSHPASQAVPYSPPIRPLEPYPGDGLVGRVPDSVEAFKGVLSNFMLEFSQLLHRTIDTYGRRREDGRAFEIQLIAVGERLDVALGEFANAVVTARTDMTQNHAAQQDLLRRQLILLEKTDAHFEQIGRQLQQASKDQGGALALLERMENHAEQTSRLWQQTGREQGGVTQLSSQLADALTSQTTALREVHNAVQGLGARLPSDEAVDRRIAQASAQSQENTLLQWSRSLDALLSALPSREEYVRMLQVERDRQTALLQGVQASLDKFVAQVPDKGDMNRLLEAVAGVLGQVPDKADMDRLLAGVTGALGQVPDKADMDRLLAGVTGALGQVPDKADVDRLLTGVTGALGQVPDKADVDRLLAGVTGVLDQVPDKADMHRLLTELQQWQAGLQEGVATRFQEVTDRMTQRFDTLDGEIRQFQESSARREHDTGLLVQELAGRFSRELHTTLQEQPHPESGEEMAAKVAEFLSARLEQTFGTLARGLSDLRERLALERNTIVATMEGWRADVVRTDQEKDQKIDNKISEVISHVSTHHTHLARVIDELNQSLSQDLDGMRDGLFSKNEESTQQLVQKVSDLGRMLEEVINTVGQEQTVFIEMLGERLEALRRRLRTK
ncbi:MAG: hypothetical protein H7838_02090 [Magnetococcus sp. DMHC-8]